MNINLVGMGMGDAATMTLAAREVLLGADVVIGSGRLLAGVPAEARAERVACPLPEDIAAAVRANPGWREVCVALSGDIGFYSGAKKLQELLADHELKLFPGISAPQYFAARLRRPWQDFRLVSAHGTVCDVLAEVLNHRAVLFLTGGATTPATIADVLREAGLGKTRVTVGENLSAPDERITSASADELSAAAPFAPLSVVLVENKATFTRDVRSQGIADDAFVRGGAPMTKREVRCLALSLLQLQATDIVYDVGAGTGSVAVEAALIARRGRVYAVENSAEALPLLRANRERFGAYNMCPVSGTAPDALASLPPPDAVFVGGSKGRLRGIIEAALAKNAAARFVISAITLETLSSALHILDELAVRNADAVQIAANRVVARGGYRMLEAQNPVFLISGGGR